MAVVGARMRIPLSSRMTRSWTSYMESCEPCTLWVLSALLKKGLTAQAEVDALAA